MIQKYFNDRFGFILVYLKVYGFEFQLGGLDFFLDRDQTMLGMIFYCALIVVFDIFPFLAFKKNELGMESEFY